MEGQMEAQLEMADRWGERTNGRTDKEAPMSESAETRY